MEKNLLLSVIFELVCGLACIGIGIYYAVIGKGTQAVLLLVVGAVCLVISVRNYLKMRKENKDKQNKDNNKKN